jgi:large subunit ribosomal protein L17
MRHLKAGRKLGRNASHRLALMRNLTLALFRNERIITTVEKAKEARRFVEKLITIAKRGILSEDRAKMLHARRLVIARLGSTSNAEVQPEGDENTADHRRIVVKLFDDIAPRYKERAGGYTRIIKRHERRLGDAGRTAFLELLKEGESKVRAKQPAAAPAPAPKIKDEDALSDLPQYSSEISTETTTEQPAPEQQPPASETPAPATSSSPAPDNPPKS